LDVDIGWGVCADKAHDHTPHVARRLPLEAQVPLVVCGVVVGTEQPSLIRFDRMDLQLGALAFPPADLDEFCQVDRLADAWMWV
jgi:hypothetical protein